jgi:hypothetical protein
VLLSLSHFCSLCYLYVLSHIAFFRVRGLIVFLNSPSLQRAKEEIGDRHPSYLDTGYAIGVVLLFVSKLKIQSFIASSLNQSLQPKVSGIILTVELPTRCYSGPNEDFKAIGQAACNLLTVMAVVAWLGVLNSKSCPGSSKYTQQKLQSLFHLQ